MKQYFLFSLCVLGFSFGAVAQSIQYEDHKPSDVVIVTPGKAYVIPEGMYGRIEQIIYNPYFVPAAAGSAGSASTAANATSEGEVKFGNKTIKAASYVRVLAVNGIPVYFKATNDAGSTAGVMNSLPLYIPAGTEIIVPEKHHTSAASIILYKKTN